MQIYSTGLFTQGTAVGKPSSEVAILCQEHMKMDCLSKNVYKFVKVETSWNLLPVLKIVGRTCSAASRQKSLLLSVWLGVLFLVQFNNFDRTTGFYWNYTLLLKPPILMRSCCVHLVLCELFYTSCKFCANNYLHKRSPLYSTVHPIKFLESDVMWDKYRYICYKCYYQCYPEHRHIYIPIFFLTQKCIICAFCPKFNIHKCLRTQCNVLTVCFDNEFCCRYCL